MEPVMYIVINKSLKMSHGKLGAQCSHAAVKAYALSDKDIKKSWDEGSFAKIILRVEDGGELQSTQEMLLKEGIKSSLIIDEGRTEFEPGQITALGVEIIDKEKHTRLFGYFNLY